MGITNYVTNFFALLTKQVLVSIISFVGFKR